MENFAEKISVLDTLENCERTVYRLVPNLPNSKADGNGTGSAAQNSPRSRDSSPKRFALREHDGKSSSHALFMASDSVPHSRTSSQGFRRVVKPYQTSTTSFYKPTATDAVEPGRAYQSIPQKAQQDSHRSGSNRNFMQASNSTLSKTRHGQAQLYLRELKLHMQ